MPFLHTRQIAELCAFATMADREARSDFAGGYIRGEDDYTSNFTGALRRIINVNSTTGLTATSFVLPTSVERAAGCDAAIIVESGGQSKTLLFEAKAPMLSKPGHSWDWAQDSAGKSHFSDQLARQARLNPRFAVCEIFYCEAPLGAVLHPLQRFGSSCVWHKDAVSFDASRARTPLVWNKAELLAMLAAGNVSIAEILMLVCECKAGTLWSAADRPQAGFEDLHGVATVLSVSAESDPDMWVLLDEDAPN